MKRILALVTSTSRLHLTDGRDAPSGFWAEELAVPAAMLREAGIRLEVATIGGQPPVVDPRSLEPEVIQRVRPANAGGDPAKDSAVFREILGACAALREPKDVDTLTREEIASYTAIFITGGNGAIGDFPGSFGVARLLLRAIELERPIAAVCHGPAALLAPRNSDGLNPFRGRRVTAFSKVEDDLIPAAGRLPMIVELELRLHGMEYSKAAEPWASHVVRDGLLITGQNAHSTAALTQELIKAVSDR